MNLTPGPVPETATLVVEEAVPIPTLPPVGEHCLASGRHAILEARVSALHRVASTARELVEALYCGDTPLSDDEAAICERLMEALRQLPVVGDA